MKKPAASAKPLYSNTLDEEHVYINSKNEEDSEEGKLADREIGFQAGLDGLPLDNNQSLAWKQGWRDAQEEG